MLLRRWAGSVLRKRHRTRAGSVLAMQEMRKLALLEAASDKPVHGRGDTSSSLLSSSSSSAAVLPSSPTAGEETIFELLDKAVEVACDRLKVSGGGNHDSSTMRSTSSSSLLKATSLTHFLSECRRLRLEIGEARDVQNRRHLRETIRTFWANNADGALTCCAFHGRDFGFVAGFGLVDDALHVSFPSLQLALHYSVREKSTCPCTSMVWALHYMARELNYLAKNGRQLSAPDSKQNHKKKMRKREDQMEVKHDDERCDDVVSDRGGIPALDMAAVTAEELGEFRRTLAALGIERLDLFFIHHGESGQALGSAEDALHALEFLTVVKVNDASASVQASIEAKRPRWCLSSDLYLVMTLFRHICRNSKDMKFTSVVHAFKLLRIFMPLLCHSLHSVPPPPSSPLSSSSSCMEQQPEKEEGKEKKGSDTHACFTPHADLDVVKTTSDGTAPLFNINRERRDWELRRDGVDRIVWELCAALQRKDDRFVNSFHFVQIMSTISRLPPCLLSRVPRSRRQTIQNFEVFNTRMKGAEVVNTSAEAEEAATTKSTRGGGGAQHSRRRDGRTSESPEEVWEYLISKACIFIPGLTSDQRRRVCRDLRLAVQRRERYFASPARVEKQRSTTKLSVLEMLLLPLAHELSQYPKDYEAAMFDHPPGERRDGE